MSNSIIPQLVKKDFLMMRKTILICCLVGLTAIAITSMLFGHVPNWAFINLGFTLLLVPAATCGILLLMKTIVMEKQKSTQLFIMSLPVTVKQFTMAKLLVNLPVFFAFWLVISGVAFYFAFWLGIFPYGTIPFITMIFLGVLVAYIGILSVGLIYQSYGITVIAILCFELGTPAYLWIIAYLQQINNHVYGPHMVWNATALSVVAIQIIAAVLILFITWHIQSKKRDFI